MHGMSGYLHRLAAQGAGALPAIAPRALSPFESSLPSAPSVATRPQLVGRGSVTSEAGNASHIPAPTGEASSADALLTPIPLARVRAIEHPAIVSPTGTDANRAELPPQPRVELDRGKPSEREPPALIPLRRFQTALHAAPLPRRVGLPSGGVPVPATEAPLRISIGRVEVKVADPPAKAARAARPAPTPMSLDDYLRSRR
jgi:hypothetical protein